MLMVKGEIIIRSLKIVKDRVAVVERCLILDSGTGSCVMNKPLPRRLTDAWCLGF